MTPAIALLTIAFILIKAGWKNQSVTDVALGRETRKPTGNAPASFDDQNFDAVGGGDFALPGQAHAGTKAIDGKPVALWIVPYVKWARNHGWKGQVTSGWRDPRQVVKPSPGLPVAPQGKSNHSGLVFPSGAIDVTQPGEFARALHTFPGPVPLRQGLAIGDPVHFSFTGR